MNLNVNIHIAHINMFHRFVCILSQAMNFDKLRHCLLATCPWLDSSGSLRKIELSLHP